MGTEVKVLGGLMVLAALGVAIAAGYHEWDRARDSDARYAADAPRRADRAAAWNAQLAALDRMRPAVSEMDANFPTNVTVVKRCPADVAGAPIFMNRKRLKGLLGLEAREPQLSEDAPYLVYPGFEYVKWEAERLWVIESPEGWTPTRILEDHSMVPGAVTGVVAVFDSKTHRVLCQAPVAARGSDKLEAAVLVRKTTTQTIAVDNELEKLGEAAEDDLASNFRYAVGDTVIGVMGAQVERPMGYFRIQR